jgi:hypothetical protein
MPGTIDPGLPALGIRQPWAELILRGVKTIEVRVVPTNVRGAIYVYASRKPGEGENVERASTMHGLDAAKLPRGVLIGTVEIVDCRPCTASDAAATCVPAAALRDCYVGQAGIEPQRILQEAAVLADRSDISEELQRLAGHAERLLQLLGENGPLGKQIDFLAQELHREANTILSKSTPLGRDGLGITDIGLRLKHQIEKVREQAQNLE